MFSPCFPAGDSEDIWLVWVSLVSVFIDGYPMVIRRSNLKMKAYVLFSKFEDSRDARDKPVLWNHH
jgi:hypothetical protein